MTKLLDIDFASVDRYLRSGKPPARADFPVVNIGGLSLVLDEIYTRRANGEPVFTASRESKRIADLSTLAPNHNFYQLSFVNRDMSERVGKVTVELERGRSEIQVAVVDAGSQQRFAADYIHVPSDRTVVGAVEQLLSTNSRFKRALNLTAPNPNEVEIRHLEHEPPSGERRHFVG